MRYELNGEIVESFDELAHQVMLRYDVELTDERVTRYSSELFSFEALPGRYKRKGDYSHRAVILSEHVHYWPETDREEPVVMVRFEGGRNGNGVTMLRSDFDLFYEVE